MLELKSNKTILFNGNQVDFSEMEPKKFFLASLYCDVKIDRDLKLGDLIHMLYDLKEFINECFMEEYEAIRSLICHGKLIEGANKIRIFKNAELSDDKYFAINPQSEIVGDGATGTQNVCDLTIELDEKISNGDEVLKENLEIKTKFTLLELLDVIFDDFVYALRNENILQ